MQSKKNVSRWTEIISVILVFSAASATAQQQKPPARPAVPKSLRTPLPPEILGLLANELSGQMIYNNLVKLGGAPWIREPREFSQPFYEAQGIHEMARQYAPQSARLEKHQATGTYDYPLEGELWVLEPQRRLVARLEADPALVAGGSKTADITGELVFVSRQCLDQIKSGKEAPARANYSGKLALMWSHPTGEDAKALAAAGLRGVIAFRAHERYFDPGQVVYSGGSYGQHDPLAAGFSISWRQWSELLEDLHLGKKIVLRGRTRVEKFPVKLETVYCWIPGTEPEGKGVVFTAHLFDGFIKRGANDNISGCVVELEILRAINRLIAGGDLPRPRRTIHFLWTQEFSGTYAFLKEHPGWAEQVSVNVNIDMVGEGLRKNNAVFRMGQCFGHLPSYIDGLAKSILDYLCRTNDILLTSDVPRGRPGGQYFPIPMVEKNGSLDAFRYTILPAHGGSDHMCFNNAVVAVPGVMFNIWPDQWYHADTDTPDKADPTQLKRAAFVGAACAWAAADCTDEVAGGLAEAAAEYGYQRVAQREIPRAMSRVLGAGRENLAGETAQAARLVAYGAGRELAAIHSIEGVFSGSAAARKAVDDRVREWELYRGALRTLVLEYARTRAASLGLPAPAEPAPDELQRKCEKAVPAIAGPVKGREFDLSRYAKYQEYMKKHPDALKRLKIAPRQAATILNYVNGRRSIADISACAAGELDEEVPLPETAGYLRLLKDVGWLVIEGAPGLP